MKRDVVFNVALSVALLGSVGLNLFQSKELRTVHHPRSAEFLEEGISFQPLKVKDMIGRSTAIDYSADSRPTVLYVFSPTCHWCEHNLASIRALTASSAREHFRFIGISLTDIGLQPYVRTSSLGMSQYYATPSPDSVSEYKLWSTPTTLVISPKGKLLKSWLGAYVGTNKTEIESYFSAQLPKLD